MTIKCVSIKPNDSQGWRQGESDCDVPGSGDSTQRLSRDFAQTDGNGSTGLGEVQQEHQKEGNDDADIPRSDLGC